MEMIEKSRNGKLWPKVLSGFEAYWVGAQRAGASKFLK